VEKGSVQVSDPRVKVKQDGQAELHHRFCRILVKFGNGLYLGKIETRRFISSVHQLDRVFVANSRAGANTVEAEPARRPVLAK
jgi:hypothetical protein